MIEKCEICESPAHGYHFGAVTCRACAAFFKRALLAKRFRRACKNGNKCIDFSGKDTPSCKICRLKKCVKMGMNSKNLHTIVIKRPLMLSVHIEPKNTESFITKSDGKRSFINVAPLVSRALDLLNLNCPTPLNPDLSNLQKMAFSRNASTNCQKLDLICTSSVSELWEHDFMSTARWLNHFEEFVKLPLQIKMQFLQATWHVWGRLNRIIKSGELRRKQGRSSRNLQLSDKVYVKFDSIVVDTSWISRHPIEKIRCFMDISDNNWNLEPYIQKVSELELSPVELSFMTAQLCFQYAQNRFIGTEISQICERFLEIIANDLHSHYKEGFGEQKNYAGRLSQMLAINRGIQTSIRDLRDKMHIAHTFDIYITDFSHPEMFIDTGC